MESLQMEEQLGCNSYTISMWI